MTGAVPFKTAWQDPEHVRLSMFRSPGDDSPAAVRGPLPDTENPWLDGDGSAPVPAGLAGAVRLPSRGDDYAPRRCLCKHIHYLDDMDGGFCRFCTCTDHRPAVTGDLSQEAA